MNEDQEISNVPIILTARKYALHCHESTNHLYDGKPYKTHLEMVWQVAFDFCHLIPDRDKANVLAACWLHDVIEDCRETYNDVVRVTNTQIADLVYAVTNEKGKTRKERANQKYYDGIRNTKYATFIKLCDRIANYQYSKDHKSDMCDKYEKEHIIFINNLYDVEYDEMFGYLNVLMSK